MSAHEERGMALRNWLGRYSGKSLWGLKRALADICCSGCFWPVGREGRVHIDNP